MDCATCGLPNIDADGACPRCSQIPASNETVAANRTVVAPATMVGPQTATAIPLTEAPAPRRNGSAASGDGTGALGPGSRVGPRYELVRLLGKGGMGAVYLAHDHELGREVALKVIAPHLASDPGVLARFKREIQLSSIVTHPNVLRVYDLGESDGIKFLTMQYIDGETLADVVRRERPLPVERAVALFRQVAEGLAAAHANGVLHRDLKPQNVMVDSAGHVYVTDFGLATSAALSSMTQTGALMGTPQYMSPEQVKGESLDARSDLFSLGVIFYEMLAGALPFTGDTVFQMMMVRTQAPARPVRELNPDIPANLASLVERCLAIDPALRYGSLAEVLADLDDGTVSAAPRVRRRGRTHGRGRAASIAGAVALVAVIGAAAAWRLRPHAASPASAPRQMQPRTVLIADFVNETGDSIFDGTLESALGLALEGASFITSYNRSSAQKIADKLKLGGKGLDAERATLVARREGIEVVTSGSIRRAGDGYRISIRAQDTFAAKDLVQHSEEVSSKEQVLGAATKLAADIRASLGDSTPQDVQLKQAEAFSATSLEAAHAFSAAVDLTREARHDQARAQYLEALKRDPGLGRAYIGLAVMERNLGHHAEAEKYLKEAMARLDRMSEREKFRSRGYYYLFHRDFDRAIEAYEGLVKQFPVDASGHGNLAVAYQMKRDFPAALAGARRALQLNPRNHLAQHNVGLFLSLGGDFPAAIVELQKVLELAPNYANAYIALALAQTMAGSRDEAIATWEKLREQGGADASIATEGLADLAVGEGRYGDARTLLEKGIAADVAQKNTDLLPRKLGMLAEVHLARRDTKKAIEVARRALQSTSEEYLRFAAATVLAEAGDAERATAVAGELDQQFAPETRMYAALLRGTVELQRGRPAEAVNFFKSAGQRVDAWLVHLMLGRAYLAASAFTEAQDELERCVKRRGEVTDVFLDDVPTYRLYAPVQYDLGRAGEGIGSPSAADAYRSFLARRQSDEDARVADARTRLARLPASPIATTPAKL